MGDAFQSTSWEIRPIASASFGGSLKMPSAENVFGFGVSAKVMGFEIRSQDDPSQGGQFVLVGPSFGLGGFGRVSAELPGWTSFETEDAHTLKDFEGWARLSTVGAGLGGSLSATNLTFYGISLQHGSFWANVFHGDQIDLSGPELGTGIEGGVVPLGKVILLADKSPQVENTQSAKEDVFFFANISEIIQQMSLQRDRADLSDTDDNDDNDGNGDENSDASVSNLSLDRGSNFVQAFDEVDPRDQDFEACRLDDASPQQEVDGFTSQAAVEVDPSDQEFEACLLSDAGADAQYGPPFPLPSDSEDEPGDPDGYSDEDGDGGPG